MSKTVKTICLNLKKLKSYEFSRVIITHNHSVKICTNILIFPSLMILIHHVPEFLLYTPRLGHQNRTKFHRVKNLFNILLLSYLYWYTVHMVKILFLYTYIFNYVFCISIRNN